MNSLLYSDYKASEDKLDNLKSILNSRMSDYAYATYDGTFDYVEVNVCRAPHVVYAYLMNYGAQGAWRGSTVQMSVDLAFLPDSEWLSHLAVARGKAAAERKVRCDAKEASKKAADLALLTELKEKYPDAN